MASKASVGTIAALLVVVGIGIYLVSCGKTEQPPPTTEVPPESPDPAVEEFETRRADYEEKLADMTVPALSQELAKDSQDRLESFNSPAAREVRQRAAALIEARMPVEPLAKELAATLQAADSSSHIGLLTLHKISPPTYYALDPEFRYRVLMDALSKAEVMNAWGIPHAFLTQPAARAIICEGPAIERYLYPVLDVDTKTEVFGTSELNRYEEDDENVYRVKDYALALIFAVRGDTSFEIPDTREGRDGYIETIRKQANARARVPPAGTAEGRGPQLPDCPGRGDATQTPTQKEPPAQTAQSARKRPNGSTLRTGATHAPHQIHQHSLVGLENSRMLRHFTCELFKTADE
jgi:hypothetical protein